MNEKERIKLEKGLFGVAISQLKVADFEKLMKVYQEQKNKPFMRKLIENKVDNLVNEIDYFTLVDLERFFSLKEKKIFNLFEERKLKLLPEVLKNISDPLELLKLICNDYSSFKITQLMIDRFNEVLLNNLDNINDIDSLISCFNLAKNDSEGKDMLKLKIQSILAEKSYDEVLEIQKKHYHFDNSIQDLFEDIKVSKIGEVISQTDDLKKVFQLILDENFNSKSQPLLMNYLAELVEKQIAQINDLSDIIAYRSLSPRDSKALLLLDTKFSQMLSNYSYEELQEIKRNKVAYNNELEALVELRKKEILPELLANINDHKEVRKLIYQEDLSTTLHPLLINRFTELISSKLDTIDSLSDLIDNYSLVANESKAKEILEKKIADKIEKISKFSVLFSLYDRCLLKEEILRIIRKQISLLLENIKNDEDLKESLMVIKLKSIPRDLLSLIAKYL